MLFQMCYGPEIEQIYNFIKEYPMSVDELSQKFRYRDEGNIQSLITATLTFLDELDLVEEVDGHFLTTGKPWTELLIHRQFSLKRNFWEQGSLNHIFLSMYESVFVRPNRLYSNALHQTINSMYPQAQISDEKINAWKRMMEFFGLGYRMYGGFYALPQIRVFGQIVHDSGPFTGPLQLFCEQKIHPLLPCITQNHAVYDGTVAALSFLHTKGLVTLSTKQDLPHPSYGPQAQWNWIQV